jgi:hypothetical protein
MTSDSSSFYVSSFLDNKYYVFSSFHSSIGVSSNKHIDNPWIIDSITTTDHMIDQFHILYILPLLLL